jgi:hypothetical protein
MKMVSDILTGQTAGDRQSGMTREARERQLLSNRIFGSYDRYKGYENQLKGYKNVADDSVLLLSPTGQMLSEMQSENIRGTFHAAERELYDYLGAMYDSGNPTYVLNAYDVLAAFYHDYGHLARVTNPREASQLREQIRQNTEGILLGDRVNEISTVLSPDEVMGILRDKRAEYVRLNKLEDVLAEYQASQTLEAQARKQSLTNDSTIPISLIESTNRQLLQMPNLPNNIFDVLQMPDLKGLTFDVDENAIKNRTQAVTNVYLQLKNGTTIPILRNLSNTGLTRDVTVMPGPEAMQALFEAFSPTQ